MTEIVAEAVEQTILDDLGKLRSVRWNLLIRTEVGGPETAKKLQAVTGAMFNLFEQGLRQLEQKKAGYSKY